MRPMRIAKSWRMQGLPCVTVNLCPNRFDPLPAHQPIMSLKDDESDARRRHLAWRAWISATNFRRAFHV
jgi:hypothetical protein